jgi:hypothetical protein
MAPDDNTDYASECARLAELTDNQALRDDLVALALDRMAEAERYAYSNVIRFPWRGQRSAAAPERL